MGLDNPLCICFNIALLVVHKIVVVYRDSIYEMGPEMDSLTHSLEQLDTQVYCKLVILIFYMSIPPQKKFFILWILVQCRTIVHKEDLIFPVKVYLKGITSIKKMAEKLRKNSFPYLWNPGKILFLPCIFRHSSSSIYLLVRIMLLIPI